MAIQTYVHDGEWTVADDGTWLPGIYKTEAAAIAACKLTPGQVYELWNRKLREAAITEDDVKASL